ncbi:putative ribonuclease H-like domain-containing protein [Tanacetum coccineum]
MTHPNSKGNTVPRAILMRSGQRTFNTAKPTAGVNAAKPKARHNAIKASACWVWMPKNRVVDHVSKNISASATLKRFDYINTQGRFKWMHMLRGGRSAARAAKDKEEKQKILVDLPKGKKAIGTKWVFKNKKDERGIVIKNKAKLVAQGFMVFQIDVKSAFLYGRIEEDVYVCQPPGFEDPDHPDKVYVDDIIFGSTKKELCIEFERLMKDKFQMSSMGELTFFLGLKVKQKEDGIFISQDKYVAEVLRKFNFSDVKSTSTLVDTEKTLVKDVDGDDVDVHLYRSMIGSLMYLTVSRLDIMYVVCVCARFQVTPKVSHLYAVKRIFIYLKGQLKLGLWYPRDSPFELVAYTDSDYAGASLDKKSTIGGCQFLGSRLN